MSRLNSTPSAAPADAQGRIYVNDTQNDRIQVFNPLVARTFESVRPSVPTFTAPTAQQVLPLNGVTISGTATDNLALASVERGLDQQTRHTDHGIQRRSQIVGKFHELVGRAFIPLGRFGFFDCARGNNCRR